jgi:hypothetical protein
MPRIRQIPLQLTGFIPLFTPLFVDPNYNNECKYNSVLFFLSLTVQTIRNQNEMAFVPHPL